ncbi:MAG: helix-turn-helix domain-containing protein [Chloroflexota bacterium]|nr:helix-turn-helix domain-containing protein [Chloroflexota bacterium]MDQ5865161.1 helix-turn-helix domain-containing protein [Chloroflexota bacterium]
MRDKRPDQVKERNSQLGTLMQEARRYKGQTVKRCAEEYLGITRQRYDLMEAGEANIGWAEFTLLMESLGITEEWLLPRMRDRGLLYGTSFSLAADHLPAVEERQPQAGTTATSPPSVAADAPAPSESGEGVDQHQEYLVDSLRTSGPTAIQTLSPPTPIFSADSMSLPRANGFWYSVHVLNAKGAVVYRIDWPLPEDSTRQRQVVRVQPKTRVAASV